MVTTLSGALDPRSLSASPQDSVDLGAVGALLLRRWWVVALLIALFLGAGLGYVAVATKIYSATTRVLLEPRDRQLVGTDLAGPSQGPQPGWIETQVDLVTAFATLKKVVNEERLYNDPEFAGTGGNGDIDAVVRSLAEHVRAERTADTYVIDVIVSSTSPDKAARLSIAVAEAFISSSTETKQNAARQANDLLLRQVDELKARARDADERVQAYRAQHGLLQVDGKAVDEQTLSQLNEAAIAARVKADAAEERWRKIDALARSGSADFGAALDGVDSAVLGRLKVEYAISQRQQAELAETLGARHPRMTALDAEVARTKTLILQELKSLAAKARIDADLARSQVAAMAAALADATQRVNDSGQAGVELKELEGEAALRRDVYKAFVARAQETGLQENLQVPDVRIISPAQVPVAPSQPRRSVILALALIGGLGSGVSLALYLGRPRSRRPTALPDPPFRADPERTPPTGPRIVAQLAVPAPLVAGADLTAAEMAERIDAFVAASASELGDLAHGFEPGAPAPVVQLVFGTAAPAAIAAVAVGLARAAARDGAATLLVDAGASPVNAAAALVGPEVPGVLDVELGHARPGEIGTRLDGSSIVLLPAASAGLRHRIAGHGERLAETIEDVADGFEHIVVDLGAACPPALFSALAELADDVLMVVDAGEASRDDVQAMFAELGQIVPTLRGLVVLRPAPVAVAERARARG